MGIKMKKLVLLVVSVMGLINVSFASGLHELNSFSSSSFPPPVMILAE
ncbi:hypothetical protein DR78_1319 [Francisella philomiragia]|uniref:Uncharacterized protein n=2 Tax=Francisella TaxID=262 RepID=A0AAW3DBR0_9GAMM|nr:hypothetical protein DR78_1319 [Francisella philomiragia]